MSASVATAGVGAALPHQPPTGHRLQAAGTLRALTALKALPVKGRAAKTGYTRAKFGPAWTDTDRNGCDTRNDILRRDLSAAALADNGCVVLSGVLTDPYSRVTVSFVRTSSAVQIDHVIPLANAWVTGAQKLTAARRTQLANDPLNLLATTAAMNRKKGAGDAATWLPPHKGFRCQYAARQIAVKRTYGLWVTSAERNALARILASCPQQSLPTPAVATPRRTAKPSTTATRSTTAKPTVVTTTSTSTSSTDDEDTTTTSSSTSSTTLTPTTTTSTGSGTDPQFTTCTAAKAAGYGPYYRGSDPEYYWYRDADNDGIVCE